MEKLPVEIRAVNGMLFAFGAPSGRLVRFELSGPRGGTHDSGHGSLLVPRLTILDAQGTELARTTDPSAPGHVLAQGVSDARTPLTLAFVAPVGGTYFVRVEDALGGGGAGFGYGLELR